MSVINCFRACETGRLFLGVNGARVMLFEASESDMTRTGSDLGD